MKFFSGSELYLGLVFFTLMELISIFASKEAMDDFDESPEKSSQVEVRAVFINCEPVEGQSAPDSEITRFQRQELFKHNTLRDCNRKLALTVKMSSEPNGLTAGQRFSSYEGNSARSISINTPYSANSWRQPEKSPGEEYIPIDHVFEGTNMKRVRLVNPYILRLLRESPLQAYMLHRMDTVSGILLQSDRGKFEDKDKKKRSRMQRDVDHLSEADEWSQVLGSAASVFTLEHEDPGRQSYSVRVGNLQELMQDMDTTSSTDTQISLSLFNETTKSKKVTYRITTQPLHPVLTMFDRQKTAKNLPKNHHKASRDVCVKDNQTWIREKRQKQIKVVNGAMDHRAPSRFVKNHYIQRMDQVGDIPEAFEMPNDVLNSMRYQELERSSDSKPYLQSELYRPDITGSISHEAAYESEKPHNNKDKITTETENDYQKVDNIKNRNVHKYPDKVSDESKSEYESNYDNSGRDFALYEIGSPNLWYTVHVQLFEKLSTSEGKTVWNDITKGEQASVSSVHPEWLGQDMSLRYRPAEWVSRDDYTLPRTSLCLLEPLRDDNANISDDDTFADKSKYREYIVVPIEDVIGLETNKIVDKRNDENSQNFSSTSSSYDEKQSRRRVEIRVSRALFGGSGDSFNIAKEGSDQFLTLPHRRPHHAQIDLEVRADDNELVRVGVITRDCGPELSGLINEKGSESIAAGPVLLPPKHTRRLRLELPIEIPVDVAHCSVALVNDEEEAVAVRDVVIKKGDRCFCVWHCSCVCLSEDPKLICREMSPSRQAAAGLSSQERPRHARSCCYKDDITLNMTIIMIGVLLTLLILGIIKALLGLECRCVGSWGLDRLLQMPRKLDHYHERHLRHLPVQYDEECWPVHPETKKRTVRLLSRSMEFMLNLVFFVTVPCLLLYDTLCSILAFIKQLISKKKQPKIVCDDDTKECFSSQDMQSVVKSRRRRRKSLRRWMTPHAEQLSADIWLKGLTPNTIDRCETLQPLLLDPRARQGGCVPPPCADSEQDDTDYVLMQMQKSRESLLRSQRKPNDSGVSTARNQWKGDAMQSRR